MHVLVAGGAGVLGRRLVPQLVARGHQVAATTSKAKRLLGWELRHPSWVQGFKEELA